MEQKTIEQSNAYYGTYSHFNPYHADCVSGKKHIFAFLSYIYSVIWQIALEDKHFIHATY